MYWNGNKVRKDVLIETYWNVKILSAIVSISSDMVLIETYWNVKYHLLSL